MINLVNSLKKITLLHSIVYTFKNKFLRKIDINFIKTITWLNKIEEDLIFNGVFTQNRTKFLFRCFK